MTRRTTAILLLSLLLFHDSIRLVQAKDNQGRSPSLFTPLYVAQISHIQKPRVFMILSGRSCCRDRSGHDLQLCGYLQERDGRDHSK